LLGTRKYTVGSEYESSFNTDLWRQAAGLWTQAANGESDSKPASPWGSTGDASKELNKSDTHTHTHTLTHSHLTS